MDVVALEKTEEYQGRYRVERTLGAGGMGVVYLAEDIKLGRKVAIKQLRSDLTGNSAEARFRSEAQLLARLNHPNIVRLYDVLEEKHSIALVMELVEGVTLKEWMRENSPTLVEKLDLLMQICQGLGKAHCLGIIHRDLKPENILVTIDGVAKITDFGIAKALDCDEQLTREDHIAGSVQAMSPEQLQGTKLDARSDLFSLGSIAYEILCGAKPFKRDDMNALAFAHHITSKPHIPAHQAWPEIPKPLSALLDRLLGKHPEQRPDNAQQVFEALELVRKHGIDDSTLQYSETVTQLLIKPRKKRGRLSLILGGFAALSLSAYWAWHTLMQLPPQYIAVLPIEINGNIPGGENNKALIKALVRQALVSTPAKLKSSALISFDHEENDNFDKQLKELQILGTTDVLFARLDCIEQRCNIELQRINPQDSRITGQTSFTFLTNRPQEAQYSIGTSAIDLFPSNYKEGEFSDIKMAPADYAMYLSTISKLATPEIQVSTDDSDLDLLEELISKYPQNANLYRSYADVALARWVGTNNKKFLTYALGVLANAEENGLDKTAILEARLVIKSVGNDIEGFKKTIHELQSIGYPSANLYTQFSRFLYIQGDYTQGAIYGQQAIDLNPSSAHSHYVLAMNQVAAGNYVDARDTLKKIVELSPGYWVAYALLGVIELETGNLSAAEIAISSIPEESRTWGSQVNLGTIFFLQGKYSKSLDIYLKELETSPENLLILNQIAETYLMLSDRSKAREIFTQIIRLTNDSSELRPKRYRAGAFAYLGKTSDSIALIMELLRKSPDDTYVKHTATQVYALAGEWQSASYYLEQLLEQKMSIEWFALPAFQQICNQPQVSQVVLEKLCNRRTSPKELTSS
ncbi:protein kinase domain-containing protein [Microbulbifer sp. SSSA008]|uniref:protein kinase domain-containing protein n=1 Tax=Microbulbifer sp. SSSA008 TaxID=3243380 RepID=UPI004039F856